MPLEFSWFYVLYAVIIFVLFIGVRIILNNLRKKTLNTLNNLLYLQGNYYLYQELLSNKRLKILFRTQVIFILRLNGYLLEGNDELVIEYINKIDNMKLEPLEKVDYYQKRFSYFVEHNHKDEANSSLNMLKTIISQARNPKVNYIVDEAELVYGIYIEHNTKLIPKLIEISKKENDRIVQGITFYRIAKLYYYENNQKQVDDYLNKAQQLVEGTYWYPIVLEAKKDHSVLALK